MRRDAWAGALLWWSCQSHLDHRCSLVNYLNIFWGWMMKLNAIFDADSLLYFLSHFECDSHTVHMLTISPTNSTVKLSLFTHVHSSPLSLGARLYWCHTKNSHYIKNGWTFSGQTSYSIGKDINSVIPSLQGAALLCLHCRRVSLNRALQINTFKQQQ